MISAPNDFCCRSRHRSRDSVHARGWQTGSKPWSGGRSGAETLAFGSRRLAVAGFSSQQNLTQHVKIAPQHAKPDVALITHLGPIPATLQAVPDLQAIDSRFDAVRIGDEKAVRAVPDSAALQLEAVARNPGTPLLWKPGMPVSVRVDVAGNDAARVQIADALQQRLQAAGSSPADGAPAVLSFHATLTGTDESLKYRRMGVPPSAGASTVSVDVQKLTSFASLGDRHGNSWWKQDVSAQTSGAPIEINRQDEDLNTRFQNRLWQGAVQFASQLPLPSRVYLVNGQTLVLPAPISLTDGR